MSPGMHQRIAQWAPVGILCLSVIALFYRLFIGEVIYWGTPMLQFYPWEKLAFDQIRQGQLPLWNPLVGNGAPLLANYQVAVFYPPNWLYLLIPTEYAMGFIGLLHVVWAGLGMAAYLRRLGIGSLGQGVGMLAFALCGYLISRFGFLSITAAVPWLPWLMWAVDGLAMPDRSSTVTLRRVATLSVIVAMQLLAGHAQISFYSLLMAIIYAFWRTLTSQGRAPLAKFLTITRVAGGMVLGAGVAAIQLIPTVELMLTSQRLGGVEPLAGLSYSFWPWRLLTLLAPNLFGTPAAGNFDGYGFYWEDANYIGLLPLVMAGHCIARWVRERATGDVSVPARVVPFFLISLPIVFIFALGRNTPVFQWLFDRHVPGFVTFQAPTRWMILAEFALCALAAIGIDVWKTSERGMYWTRLLTAGGVAVFAGSLLATRFLVGVRSNFVPAMLWLGVWVIIAGSISLVLPQVEAHPQRRPLWEIAVVAVVALDLVIAHWGLTPTLPASYYHQSSRLAEVAKSNTPDSRTFYPSTDEENAKFADPQANRTGFFSGESFDAGNRARWDELRSSLLPNLGMLDGIRSANNFDPLLVDSYDALMKQFGKEVNSQAITTMQQMNVGLLLSTAPCGGLETVAQSGRITACRVPDPWPRAVLAECTEMADHTLRCDKLLGHADVASETPTQITITVTTERSVTLLLLDTYYPGWQAFVDGNPQAVRRANTAFRSVAVPPGKHMVVFSYQPLSLLIGAGVTGISLIVLIAIGMTGRRRTAGSQPQGLST